MPTFSRRFSTAGLPEVAPRKPLSAQRERRLFQEVEGVLEPVLHARGDDRVADAFARRLDEERESRASVGLGEGRGVEGRTLFTVRDPFVDLRRDDALVRGDLVVLAVE